MAQKNSKEIFFQELKAAHTGRLPSHGAFFLFFCKKLVERKWGDFNMHVSE